MLVCISKTNFSLRTCCGREVDEGLAKFPHESGKMKEDRSVFKSDSILIKKLTGTIVPVGSGEGNEANHNALFYLKTACHKIMPFILLFLFIFSENPVPNILDSLRQVCSRHS